MLGARHHDSHWCLNCWTETHSGCAGACSWYSALTRDGRMNCAALLLIKHPPLSAALTRHVQGLAVPVNPCLLQASHCSRSCCPRPCYLRPCSTSRSILLQASHYSRPYCSRPCFLWPSYSRPCCLRPCCPTGQVSHCPRPPTVPGLQLSQASLYSLPLFLPAPHLQLGERVWKQRLTVSSPLSEEEAQGRVYEFTMVQVCVARDGLFQVGQKFWSLHVCGL